MKPKPRKIKVPCHCCGTPGKIEEACCTNHLVKLPDVSRESRWDHICSIRHRFFECRGTPDPSGNGYEWDLYPTMRKATAAELRKAGIK